MRKEETSEGAKEVRGNCAVLDPKVLALENRGRKYN